MTEIDHLGLAKQYLAIAESGDARREAYRAAAEEIAAALLQQGMTQRAAAKALDKSVSAVEALLRWRKSGYKADTPWLADTGATTRAATSHTKQILRDAPMEQVERILVDLPPERRKQVAAAAGNAYFAKVVEHEEKERNLTERERQERRAATAQLTKPLDQALGAFGVALGVVSGHIEDAIEELRSFVDGGQVTAALIEQLDEVTARWLNELEVARGIAELEEVIS